MGIIVPSSRPHCGDEEQENCPKQCKAQSALSMCEFLVPLRVTLRCCGFNGFSPLRSSCILKEDTGGCLVKHDKLTGVKTSGEAVG